MSVTSSKRRPISKWTKQLLKCILSQIMLVIHIGVSSDHISKVSLHFEDIFVSLIIAAHSFTNDYTTN